MGSDLDRNLAHGWLMQTFSDNDNSNYVDQADTDKSYWEPNDWYQPAEDGNLWHGENHRYSGLK